MRSINRIALFTLFALQQFAGTGRPSVFAGRKALRAVKAWFRNAQQGMHTAVEDARDWLADGLIRLSERLVPLPQAVPVFVECGATPYVDLPEPERVPAPSFDPVPECVWHEIEQSKEVKTLSVEEGLEKMDEIIASQPAKKARKAKSAAHTPAKPKAKRTPTAQPKDKKDPIREAKYREVAFHVSCGDAVKAACKKVGVAESSYRAWAKKQAAKQTPPANDAPDRCHYCRTGEGAACDCV
jgi:hypothetical protein